MPDKTQSWYATRQSLWPSVMITWSLKSPFELKRVCCPKKHCCPPATEISFGVASLIWYKDPSIFLLFEKQITGELLLSSQWLKRISSFVPLRLKIDRINPASVEQFDDPLKALSQVQILNHLCCRT